MRYFPIPVDDLDLVDRMDGRRKAAVDTEDLVVDDHTQCEEIKHVCEIVPNIGIAILACALCVESIGLRNAS